ncbi:thiol:disulfide interchange protein [Sphingomonas oleivorans]|uniref:Thiol:disulfide interchange protein n=1 Tax=Sphingomonas oleivorans TaxID=1735121 RepID=A0A2T5FUC2_9SPHN|nr:thiol:disulfide interchange protein [Sphingomonas oleivorans]
MSLAACDRQKAEQPQAQPGAEKAPKVESGKVDHAKKGEAAPDAAFADGDEAPVTIASFKGKPLLVNLWATWCAPCVAEMPTLDALAEREAGRMGLIVVSQDMEGRRAVSPFFAKAKFRNLKPYLDKENGLMLALKADTLPMTILYDAEGREIWRVTGAMDWTSAKAKALIDQGLAGGAAAAPGV